VLLLVLMDSLRKNTAGHDVSRGVKATVGCVCVCVCESGCLGMNVAESGE